MLFGSTRQESKKKAALEKGQLQAAAALGERVASSMNPDATSPNMAPEGPRRAKVYILGEAPGAVEDKAGRPFVGPAGRVLRRALGTQAKHCRLNNVVRTRPPDNRDPTEFEVECYRQTLEADILATKPRVVVLVGRAALLALIEEAKGVPLAVCRGTPFASSLGGHKFWAVPVLHPSYLLHMSDSKLAPALSVQFTRDIKNACKLAKAKPPRVYNESSFFTHPGTELVTGHNIDDLKRVERFVNHAIEAGGVISADIETDARSVYDGGKMLSIAVASKDRCISVAIEHPQAGWDDDTLAEVEGHLQRVLGGDLPVVWHSGTFDLEWLAMRWGIDFVLPGGEWRHWHDTMAAHYSYDHRTESGKGQALDYLARMRLGTSFKAYAAVDRTKLANEELLDVLAYNAADTRVTRTLHFVYRRLLKKDNLLPIYDRQRRRVPTLALSQTRGAPNNGKIAKRTYRVWKKKLAVVERRLNDCDAVQRFKRIYGPFSPSKEKHLRGLFAGILKFDIGTGKGSLDADVLRTIPDESAALVLEWRSIDKMLSTYLDKLRPDVEDTYVSSDGRVHAQAQPSNTATSRLAYKRPNLQNQQKRDLEKMLAVRGIFKPEDGRCIACWDFGQIEWRFIGVASQDQYIIDSIHNGVDVHLRWAREIAKRFVRYIKVRFPDVVAANKAFAAGDNAVGEKKMKPFRAAVKNEMVFPACYLAAEDYIAKMLGVPPAKFRPLFKKFWQELSGVKKWQRRLVREYNKYGCVYSLIGRRYVSGTKAAVMSEKDIANYPIQGTAGEFCVEAMCRITERAVAMGEPDLIPIVQIHDDLTFEWNVEDVERFAPIVIEEMLRIEYDWINVPLVVEGSVGLSWADQQDVGTFQSDRWQTEWAKCTLPELRKAA